MPPCPFLLTLVCIHPSSLQYRLSKKDWLDIPQLKLRISFVLVEVDMFIIFSHEHCWRILSLMCLLSGCSRLNSFSKMYTSLSVNLCFFSLSTHRITSSNQPLVEISFSSRKNRVFFHPLRTFSFGSICRSRMKNIFPVCGILLSKILQPTQPARRAVDVSGLRSSIIPGTKKCFGTTRKFNTSKVLKSEINKSKFGL